MSKLNSCYQKKYFFLGKIIFVILLIGLNVASICVGYASPSASKKQISSPAIGSKLYLQGMGSDPQTYYSKSYFIDDIVHEAPNTVTALTPNPYGRRFTTEAKSHLVINGNRLTAKLTNFRDLVIINQYGKTLLNYKASGATSLFDVGHQSGLIGWGIGWHKYKRKYYPHVDFTVFRLFFPLRQNGKWVIAQHVFRGLIQSEYQSALLHSNQYILVEGTQLGDGAYGCYYCLPNFFVIDHNQGIYKLETAKALQQFVNINRVNPLMMVYWLAEKNQPQALNKYIAKNFDKIVTSIKSKSDSSNSPGLHSPSAHAVSLLRKNKQACLNYLNAGTKINISVANTIQECLPLLLNEKYYYSSWFEGEPWFDARIIKSKLT